VLKNDYQLRVIDAIAEKKTREAVIAEVGEFRPAAVLCLVGAASWTEDVSFLAELRSRYRGLICAAGDVFMERPERTLEMLHGVDSALLDFTSPGFGEWVDDPREAKADMIIRGDGRFTAGPGGGDGKSFSVGTPAYALFPNGRYRYPFVKRRPFATVLTDYGCPYPCTYCIMNTIGYRTRPVEEVVEELLYLKELGFRELYFNDQTFGASRARCMELLETMERERLNFGWVCFTRTDVFDEELAEAMRRAGCHTVMFGVESASEDILTTYNKKTGVDSARDAIRLCRGLDMRTVATFLLGFPEDDELSVNGTIELALELAPDYASFNFAVPRRGTGLRRKALSLGLAHDDDFEMDQGGEEISMPTRHLSREEMAALRRKALRRFYLRPGYLVKRMLNLRTPYEVSTAFLEGATVIRNALFAPKKRNYAE